MMPIWIALPFLVVELALAVAIGYLLIKYWFYALFAVVGLTLELVLLTSAINIWRHTFILTEVA